MNNTTIPTLPNTYHVCLRQDLVMLCEKCEKRKEKSRSSSHCKALILSILDHWTHDNLQKGKGISIHITVPQWESLMYGLFKRNVIMDSLEELCMEGWIERQSFKPSNGGREQYRYTLKSIMINTALSTLKNQLCQTEEHGKINDQGGNFNVDSGKINYATLKNQPSSSVATLKNQPLIEDIDTNIETRTEERERDDNADQTSPLSEISSSPTQSSSTDSSFSSGDTSPEGSDVQTTQVESLGHVQSAQNVVISATEGTNPTQNGTLNLDNAQGPMLEQIITKGRAKTSMNVFPPVSEFASQANLIAANDTSNLANTQHTSMQQSSENVACINTAVAPFSGASQCIDPLLIAILPTTTSSISSNPVDEVKNVPKSGGLYEEDNQDGKKNVYVNQGDSVLTGNNGAVLNIAPQVVASLETAEVNQACVTAMDEVKIVTQDEVIEWVKGVKGPNGTCLILFPMRPDRLQAVIDKLLSIARNEHTIRELYDIARDMFRDGRPIYLGNLVNDKVITKWREMYPVELPQSVSESTRMALVLEIKDEYPNLFIQPENDENFGLILLVWYGATDLDYVILQNHADWESTRGDSWLMERAVAYGDFMASQQKEVVAV